MAALEALTSGLTPPDEDLQFLKEVGVLPSTSSSTTTTPYTSGGDPLNPNTGTTDTGVLQAIQQLDTKLTDGFAQVMAKLSNNPVKSGGGDDNFSTQSIEMSPNVGGATTFLNNLTRKIANLGDSARSMFSTANPTSTSPAAPAGPAPTVSAGGGKTRRKGGSQMESMNSTSTLAGGRRRKTRKSRQRRR
jgi:hypothetical protein